MQLANQRPGKPDKLSLCAYSQTSYSKIQWENSLDKKGTTEPQVRQREKQRKILKKQEQRRMIDQELGQEQVTTHAAGS